MLTKIRSFLRKLFPPELAAYVPGHKLIAGVILYVAATAFGVGGDQVIELPLVGEVSVAEAALGVGFYLFPNAE